MSDAGLWERAKDLFERAVELPEDERAGFVERETHGEQALADEVLTLLRVYREEDEFLETPAVPPLDERTPEPDGVIGPYRLLHILGSGGMGVVYEGERADDAFHKRVAIKFIRSGMDSERIVRRFRRERSILASLDHPNIARLLDGGVASDGRPYFVMEYVQGRPITSVCEEDGLSLNARLDLFQKACAAVHFAHRNLVIHRDLKPSNLLVDADGQVKLLDFGVAKLLEHEPDPEVQLTQLGERILTPHYASPEQLRGRGVTTATDIYSLGVILYELIAGRRPFEATDGSPEELAARVAAGPVPPSEVVRSDPGGALAASDARGLRSSVARELDSIVLMAIREEPERRYPSAAALADDVHRYLGGLPVVAQPDTASYRLRKFLQRHRGSVAAACFAGLALFAGGVSTAWQARVAERERDRAEQRFNDVRTLTNALLFEVHDAIADLPGATSAREVVVRRAFEYLDRLAAQSDGEHDLDREIAEGYLRLGGVLGSPSGASLGDIEAAREAYERAVAIARSVVNAAPGDREAARTLALSLRRIADLVQWTAGGAGEAAETLERSRALFEDLAAGADSDDVTAHLEVVIAWIKLGDVSGHPFFPNVGRADLATGWYQRARLRLDAPPLASSGAWSVRRYRGLVEERLGAMHRDAGRMDEALEHFAQALAVREGLARETPTHLDALRDVAVSHQVVCEVQSARGMADEALVSCRQADDAFTRLRDLDPDNYQGIADLARIQRSMSGVLARAGDREGSEAALVRAIALRHELAEIEPAHAPNRVTLAQLRLALAGMRIESGAADAAAELLRVVRSDLAALDDEGADVSDEMRQLTELAARLAGRSGPAGAS